MSALIHNITSKLLTALRTNVIARRILTLIMITISALMQAYAIMGFIKPDGLIASGFTGLALLVEKLTELTGFFTLPTQIGMILLNIPIGLLCWHVISKHFVIMSIIQVLLTTLFMTVIPFKPPFNDTIMLTLVAGLLYGGGIAVALRGGACTMGTDLISMYVASKTGKPIWRIILAGNIFMYLIFGFMFGWLSACYTACFQYVSTRIIETFYNRYDKYELTIKPSDYSHDKLDNIMLTLNQFHHDYNVINNVKHENDNNEMSSGNINETSPGNDNVNNNADITIIDSNKIIIMVCSSYELNNVIHAVNIIDNNAVITSVKLNGYHGVFNQAPADEPVIINVDM